MIVGEKSLEGEDDINAVKNVKVAYELVLQGFICECTDLHTAAIETQELLGQPERVKVEEHFVPLTLNKL